MAITMGFTPSLSDQVVVGTYFQSQQTGGTGSASTIQTPATQNVVSTYVLVSVEGNLVYENQFGTPQYISNCPAGLIPLSATRILASGTVNGTPRTTTATVTTWMGDYKY